MNYTANEDRIFSTLPTRPAHNAVIDVLFVEESGFDEPVTVAEALQLCNIDDLGQDTALIEVLITTARQQCEAYTNIGFIQRTVTAVVNNSLGDIYLPYGPVVEVDSVEYKDGTAADYEVFGVAFKQLATPKAEWLKVTYTAGYSDLLRDFKTAILQQVNYLDKNRGDADKMATLSPMAKTILKPHRRVWF